jgi:hypothetical protein
MKRDKSKSLAGPEIRIGDVRIFELRDVAGRLGLSMASARRYVRTGRLAAQKVGVKWMISEDALREFFLKSYTPPKHKEGRKPLSK